MICCSGLDGYFYLGRTAELAFWGRAQWIWFVGLALRNRVCSNKFAGEDFLCRGSWIRFARLGLVYWQPAGKKSLVS